MRNEYEVNRAIDIYSDMIKRISLMYLKNNADTEDIFQTVFMKYLLSETKFKSEEHEKAWFIRVTINCCKDLMKNLFRKNTVPLDAIAELSEEITQENSDVIEAVLSLPKKYKEVVYLYFYEEYTAVEISKILKKKVNTVYTLLSRAKAMLRERLGGDEFE